MIAARASLRRGMAAPIMFAVLSALLFVALGTWQLGRRGEKLALIETLDRRLSAAPVALAARNLWPQLDQGRDEYRRVRFSAAFVPGEEALVYAGPSPFPSDLPGAGYWVFALARRANGDRVVIDRGYVPEEEKDAKAHTAHPEPANIDMIGVMRWPQARNFFTPADDPARDLWFARDPGAIARAKEWGEVAPFYVELEAPAPPGGLPRPAPARPNLRNAHLQYAITWYGLAAVTIVMLGFWVRTQRG
ncbi:MAG TPA: SURF1 family protein [Xanthobacteraceae bacterium]|jgi:cytochrome oxidase assembly protein ShyY1